jgi:hypothetical protein
MTCRNCSKVGHIAAFCTNDKTTDTNVQDGEVHEEAAQQLLDAVQAEVEDDNFYADLFLCEDQEHRSVSLQIKDGINGGRIPKDWVLLNSQSMTDAFSTPDLLKKHSGSSWQPDHPHTSGQGYHQTKRNSPRIRRRLVLPRRYCKHTVSGSCGEDSIGQIRQHKW